MKNLIDNILSIFIILLFALVILDVIGMVLFLPIIDGCPSIFELICKLF